MKQKRCNHDIRSLTKCGNCKRIWCEKCDPAPAALCHYCNGRGYSHAPRNDKHSKGVFATSILDYGI